MTDTNKRSSGFAQARFQNLASTVLSTTTITTTTAFSPLLQTSLPPPPPPSPPPLSFCHPGGSGGRQRVPRHIHHHLGWSLVTDVIRRTDKRHRRRNQCAKGQVAYVCVQITVYLGHPWSGPGWRTAPIPRTTTILLVSQAPRPRLWSRLTASAAIACHFRFRNANLDGASTLEPRGRGSIESCLRIRRCRCLRANLPSTSLRWYRTSFFALPFTKAVQTRRLFVPFNLRSRSSTPFTVPDIITLDQISSFVPPSLERARTDTFVYDSKGISLSLSLSLFPSLNLKLADGNGEEGEKDNISRSYNGINSKSEFSNSVLLPRYPSCSSFSILFGAELVAGTIAGTRES